MQNWAEMIESSFQPLTICSTVKSCHVMFLRNIWDNVFKNEPNKTCGIQPLKDLRWF